MNAAREALTRAVHRARESGAPAFVNVPPADPLGRLCVTWETVTAESAEHGDAEARGFARPVYAFPPLRYLGVDLEDIEAAEDHGRAPVYRLRLRDALDALQLAGEPWRELEAIETDGDWFSVIWSFLSYGPARDLPGGERVLSVTLSLHFPENTSPASRARIARALRAAL